LDKISNIQPLPDKKVATKFAIGKSKQLGNNFFFNVPSLYLQQFSKELYLANLQRTSAGQAFMIGG
jgi:hypothetical protein